MWLQTFFKSLTSTPTRRQPPRRSSPASRLCLEPLEERCLLSFNPAVSYPAGTSPHALLTADFNGDGRLDLATANFSSSNVSVLLGNVDGTFQPAQNSPTGATPLSVAVGDFNADGKLDLATANAGDVSVLLGNGDGTFGAGTSIGVAGGPQSVAVGDFNADGKLDLGVTSNVNYHDNYGDFSVGFANVLLGNGTGSFAAPIASFLGYGRNTSAAVADFNGDLKQDFASANLDYGKVSVLLGTGAGAFEAPTDFGAPTDGNVGNYPRSVTAGDVNGDGKLDVVTANVGGNVSVLLGNGLGGFVAGQNYAAGSLPRYMAIANFNGDGHIDLVTANWDTGTVSVLLGAGTGAFKPPVNVATAAGPFGVAVGDFNGDGRPDAASANSGSNNVSVLLNDGTWPALDTPPSITIADAAAVTEGNTGTVSANFTVTLSAAYGQTVSVHYATADGSATLAGGDYQAVYGTLIFAPGETSKPVTVLVNGDRLAESIENFFVRLSDPTNAFVADSTGAGTILDDEPTVRFAPTYVTGLEGNNGTTPFTFTVTLSAAYDAPVTVDYATADFTSNEEYWYQPGATAGVDYTGTSGTVTFAAGETSQTITVLVTGDRLGESRLGISQESFFVNLSNPTSAHISNGQALGTILDDEPTISIVDYVSGAEGNTSTTAFTFTVTLSAVYDAPVTVDYATADLQPYEEDYYGTGATAGVDYTATSGTVTFVAGQTSSTFTVLVNGDRVAEDHENFFVNLSNPTSAHLDYDQALGIIMDDEPRGSIRGGTVVEGNTGTTALTFTVTLSAAYDAPVTVTYATADGSATAGSDYQAASGTVTFAAGETSKNITVRVNGDRLGEYDEDFTVNLTGATGAYIYPSTGYGTIQDDEPRISISDVSKAEGKKRQTTLFTFTVTLSAAYDQPVTVSYRTVDGTATTSNNDYIAKTGTLTFAPGETTKTITIEVKGDRNKEANDIFYLDLFGLSSNALFTKNRGIGTILNDD